MLRTRISLLQTYLTSLPPSHLTDATLPQQSPASDALPNHEILRAIQSLLSRLPLLAPPDGPTFAREATQQRADVELTNMLASITGSLAATSQLGKRFAIVDGERSKSRKMNAGPGGVGGALPGSGGGEFAGMMGGGGGAGMGGFFETAMGGGPPYASPGEGRRFR